jgi:hypothetical protein
MEEPDNMLSRLIDQINELPIPEGNPLGSLFDIVKEREQKGGFYVI